MKCVGESEETGRAAAGADKKVSSRVYAPGEVQRSIKRVVEEKLGAFSVAGLVVEGELGEVGEGSGRYSYVYGVTLRDPVDGSVLELSIPRRLAEEARGLQRAGVRVRGDLEPNVYKGKISFRLSVREMEPVDEPADAAADRAVEKRLSGLLRAWKRGGRRFPQPPPGSRLRAAVIHPAAGVVLEDFTRQLGDAADLVEVRPLPVATNSPDEIAGAVRAAEGQIVVLIRGGGSPEDFEPFNDARVVEAWMEKDAFTVSAIGHAEDGTILDPISDLSCPTPTAAGSETRERLLAARPPTPYLDEAPAGRAHPGRPKLTLALAACLFVAAVILLLLAATTLP